MRASPPGRTGPFAAINARVATDRRPPIAQTTERAALRPRQRDIHDIHVGRTALCLRLVLGSSTWQPGQQPPGWFPLGPLGLWTREPPDYPLPVTSLESSESAGADGIERIELWNTQYITMEEETATTPNMLAPRAVASLRSSAGPMQRSFSEDIREEREELREAAEQTLNVILDLNIDGTIRWVSPSWVDVIGTQPDSVVGTRIADLIINENPDIFSEVVESMAQDDGRSQFIRFAVQLGPLSKLLPLEMLKEPERPPQPVVVDLEAQGIMVYSGPSGGESHVSHTTVNERTARGWVLTPTL